MRHLLPIVLLSACAATPTPRPTTAANAAASPANPSAPPTLFRYSLAEARALPSGPQTFALRCMVSAYFGPFNVPQGGEAPRVVATLQNADAARSCFVFGGFVDGNGQHLTNDGADCAAGAARSEMAYTYNPADGSRTSPVFLHIQRAEPEPCAQVTLTLEQR